MRLLPTFQPIIQQNPLKKPPQPCSRQCIAAVHGDGGASLPVRSLCALSAGPQRRYKRLRHLQAFRQLQSSLRVAVLSFGALYEPSNGRKMSAANSTRVELVLTKQQGEGSFGMFLAIDPRVWNAEFATVSFITPQSPAYRAGLQPGWVVLQINGQSARCSSVREVAKMFKDQATVVVTVEMRECLPPMPTPATQRLPLAPPSIESDGFEIVDIRPAVSAQTLPQQEMKVEASCTSVLSNKSPSSLSKQGTTTTGSARTVVADPKESEASGSSVTPKAAAKSVRPIVAATPVATAPGSQQVRPECKATPSVKSSTSNGMGKTMPVVTVGNDSRTLNMPQIAEPKHADAVRVVGLPLPSESFHPEKVVAPLPRGKQTVVTAPLRLGASRNSQPASSTNVAVPATNASVTPVKNQIAPNAPSTIPNPLSKPTHPHLTQTAPSNKSSAGSISASGQRSSKAQVIPNSSAAASHLISNVTRASAPDTTAPSRAAASRAAAELRRAEAQRILGSNSQPARSVANTITPTPASARTHDSSAAAAPSNPRSQPLASEGPHHATASNRAPGKAPVKKPAVATTASPAPSNPRSTGVNSEAKAATTPSPRSQQRGRKRGRPKGSSSSAKASRSSTSASPSATTSRGTSSINPTPQARSTTSIPEDTSPSAFNFHAGLYSFSSDEEGSPTDRQPRRNARRLARPRHSLTVERLEAMGFQKEDAILSIQSCGDDLEKCMIWIVSHMEERQFIHDLNQASIESERTRHDEELRTRIEETETLRTVTTFTSLFTTSYILSEDSSATRLKSVLSTKIGDVSPECFLRTILTKLLKLEGQAIRWYKESARAYMLKLATRLEAALGTHDIVDCCSKALAESVGPASCSFVKVVRDEEQELKRLLFMMPDNHGGVPLAFLEADDTVIDFNLEEDGFEMVIVAPPSDDSDDE